MRTLLSAIAVFVMLATASCSKTGGDASPNSWTVGSSTFSATNVKAMPSSFSYALVARDEHTPSPHMIIFSFPGAFVTDVTPPPAGTYKVVGSEPDATGQVSFVVNGASPSDVYHSSDNSNVSVTVSRDGDKMHILMPKTWALGGSDSMQVSADIMLN